MKHTNEAWGIEVGSNAIKAIKLERDGHDVALVDYEIIKFKHVLTTPDLDADEQIQLGLDQLLQKHEDIGSSHTIVSVPGHLGFARFAKLPPVEPKKIPEIVRFEAIQQIPFPIEQVEWDYQVFQQQDSPDVEVGIFAITKERVGQFLSNYRTVNMRVDALTLSPLAVYNAYTFDGAGTSSEDAGVVYLDIGTVSTDVVIVEEGGIWSRTLPIGGNHFTEALVKAFKISFSKAEKLKREAATSKYAKQIFQALRGVFGEMVQEVQRSLGYYQSLNRDANLTKIVAVGSTIKMPGLQKYLKQQLQMEVVRPDGFERIEMEGKRQSEFAANAINLGTAYGLALQGLGHDTVNANILPSQIIRTRMWRAKQPWIAAAAACVALAAGLTVARYYSDHATWQRQYDQSQTVVSRIIDQAEGYERTYEDIEAQSDPRQRIMNVRGMLDYRDVWPKLTEDINLALASLTPGQNTLDANDENSDTPRSQRRSLYIDSISAKYIPTPSGGNPGRSAGPRSARSRGGGDEEEGGGGILAGDFSLDTFFGKNKAPRFRITIEGTTPYQDASKLLTRRFVGWIKKHAKRKTRPYVFEVGNEPVPMLTKVGSQPSDDEDQANRGRGRSSRGDYRGRGRGRSGASRGGGERGEGGLTIDQLLPSQPKGAGPQADDWRFRVQWIVRLENPKAARDVQAPPAPKKQPAPGEQRQEAKVPRSGADQSPQSPSPASNPSSSSPPSASRSQTTDRPSTTDPTQEASS